jgi:hypothetical protein
MHWAGSPSLLTLPSPDLKVAASFSYIGYRDSSYIAYGRVVLGYRAYIHGGSLSVIRCDAP